MHLVRAKDLLGEITLRESLTKSKRDENDLFALLKSEAANLHSVLAVYQGKPMEALYYSRLAVKLMHREWANLGIPSDKHEPNKTPNVPGAKGDEVLAPMSSLAISAHAATPDAGTGQGLSHHRRIWSLIPRLFRSLLRLSKLYANGGLLPEAQYYMEQGQKVAKNAPSSSFEGCFHAQAGHYMVLSDSSESAASHFHKAELAYQAHQPDPSYVEFQLFVAEKRTLEDDFSSAELAFASAEKTLDQIREMAPSRGRLDPSEVSGLEDRMASMALAEARHRDTKPDRGAPKGKKAGVIANISARAAQRAPVNASPWCSRRAIILRQRALTAIQIGDLDRTDQLLKAASSQTAEPHQLVLQTLLEAQLYFRRGLESMASDLNFCILPESTTSCPSAKPFSHYQVGAPEHNLEKKEVSRCNKKLVTKTATRATKVQPPPVQPTFCDLLQQAQCCLNDIQALATKAAPMVDVHTLADVLSRTLVMLSSFNSSTLKATRHPIHVAFTTGETCVVTL